MKYALFVCMSALVISLVACGRTDAGIDAHTHEQEVLEWRAGRLQRLLAPTGYLNQVGLFWLEPGEYSFGSAAGNDIVFPAKAAARIGVFVVDDNGVSMRAKADVEVTSEDESVTDILIAADTTDEPVMIKHRSLAWTVVERDQRFAVRLRDYEHPFVATFGPLPYFDIDPSLRVEATLKRYDEPRIANVGTVIEGLGYHPESPGVVVFEIDGKEYELEAYNSGELLFFVFGDHTGHDDTYGAGRFLYAEVPGDDGKTVLDFNKAYSPPCAFNDFSTCPVASPRNRLPIRIEAGEKYDPALHYAADYRSIRSNVRPALARSRSSSGSAMADAGVMTPPPLVN